MFVTHTEEKHTGNVVVNTICGIILGGVIAGGFLWIMNYLLIQ